MLKQTLDAVARLDYPNFECVLIINNTPDPASGSRSRSIAACSATRFKFVRADKVEGFKAGALRIALDTPPPTPRSSASSTPTMSCRPDWLKDLVPALPRSRVGLVQAPQDHRDGDRSVMHHAMNGEYAGFFDIGMVERNENNAIVVHGTMCLIRRAALEAAGNWSSDTICEDTDLGLTMLELGWHAHYTNRRYGYGLLPDTFEAYKKQRDRWAYGGFQIVKKHWRRFLPGAPAHPRPEARIPARLAQLARRRELGVVVAILNILWVPVVAFLDIAVPDRILTVPIMASFAVSVAHFFTLYRLRVRTGRAAVRLGIRRHVAAVDGGARGRLRPDQGSPALRRTAKGGAAPRHRLPRLLGSDSRRAADHRRDHADRDQLQAGARNLYLRRRAGDPEPAFHLRRRPGVDRALQAQRLFLLDKRRGARHAAAAGPAP